MSNINLEDLQEQVMEKWDEDGVEYTVTENHKVDGQDNFETLIESSHNQILSNPMLCIQELGYNSISEYIRGNKLDSYQDYLEYLKINKIDAPKFVKDWAKLAFKERDEKHARK